MTSGMTQVHFAYALIGVGICWAISAAYFLTMRYQESVKLGAHLMPLSPDDRLRVALAITALETAEKELVKLVIRDHLPGHPHASALLDGVITLKQHARRLRES